jgi:SPP1 gp7 family putative phage head morphogenesis protein
MDTSILLEAFSLKPADAIAFFRKKKIAINWNWHDTWKQAHAQSFTVAKMMNADLLQDVKNMVDRALDEGLTVEQFKKELTPTLQAKKWWGEKEIIDQATGKASIVQLGSARRLERIYKTNLQTAYMAGRYKGQQASVRALPYYQFIAIIDGQTTDRCRNLHLKIFRHDDPIWNYLYPPNHWGCRSRVRSLSESDLQEPDIIVVRDASGATTRYEQQRSLSSSEGNLVKKDVTIGKGDNTKTVSVTGYKLDEGNIYWADPGWDYNPGQTAFKPDLNRYDSDIRKQL